MNIYDGLFNSMVDVIVRDFSKIWSDEIIMEYHLYHEDSLLTFCMDIGYQYCRMISNNHDY